MRAQQALTPKQEAFCLSYLETGNASEAYRRAYEARRMAQATISRNAKALLDNNKIAARLEVLRRPAVEKAKLTLEGHLQDLARLRDLAEASQKYAAAVQAEVARGRAAGLYGDRGERGGLPLVTFKDLTGRKPPGDLDHAS
jgi:phage terminase small subunit